MTPDELFSRILPDVPGCPDSTVSQAIIDAVIEFCSITQIISEIEAPITLVEDVHTYSIADACGMKLEQITSVHSASTMLRPTTIMAIGDKLPDWQTATSPDPTYYYCPDGDMVRFFPTPKNLTGQQITIVATWRPRMNSTSFPDSFGQDYFDEIVSGAKARLMMTPNRSWSNPALAQFYRTKFEAGASNAQIDAIKDRTKGSLMATPVKFE